MIYTVECSFTNPTIETEWNDFYSLEKLPRLISVTGFHTSQRFKALSKDCPIYLAIHSIDDPHILQGEEYHQKGGGNFARWQPYITDWYRNIYEGIDCVPAIYEDEYLIVSELGPEPLIKMNLSPDHLHAVALAKYPENRWLTRIHHGNDIKVKKLPKGVHLYSPITAQLTNDSPMPIKF